MCGGIGNTGCYPASGETPDQRLPWWTVGGSVGGRARSRSNQAQYSAKPGTTDTSDGYGTVRYIR